MTLNKEEPAITADSDINHRNSIMKPQGKVKGKDSENKHSPLPWNVDNDLYINEGTSFHHAVCKMVTGHNRNAQANADLIVTAVNSHEQLVKALENTTQRLYLLKKHIDILQKSTGSKHGSCHVIEGIEILTKNNEQALADAKG